MSEHTEVSTMHIGAVAERTGLSLRTLRHWDEVGLVQPSGRSDGGFRLYTEDDVERILLVRRMKPLGFTLAEMGELLEVADRIAGGAADAAARSRLAELLASAQQRRAELAGKLDMADEFIAKLRALTA
ncbi:MerR family transcriptional regulator [Prauserella rugosa]|uniref:DNA-binding transcriptional MerR regulator n=1 Tax=Prauserella rugosa TaxID=43354 RepID=A0A660CA63_9PSEU|nr:MerR family transcriptional regulator [Prauserella rugosa]KMS87190.1 MerR family transcriptional regulator [Streptomyces regensis]TWH18429.1 DNA-binding transcriptional MerR regulator [Prauserella rugosa]